MGKFPVFLFCVFLWVTEILSDSIPSKVFIYYGGVDNLEVFQSNYRILKNSGSTGHGQGFESNCMIVLSENKTRSIGNIVGNSCQITEFYRGEFIEYVKLLTPSLVRGAGYSHVMIIDSRTKFSNYNLRNVLEIMKRNNLSVAIPYLQIPGQSQEQHKDKERTVGSLTEILELNAPIFTISAWQCFWDMINPGLNPSGAGYDIYFYHFCSTRMRSQQRGREGEEEKLKIGRLNGMRIGTLPPIQKYFVRTKLDPVEQLRNWIEYLRNERGGVIRKGEKGEIAMLL
jgi:hypothetical protein